MYVDRLKTRGIHISESSFSETVPRALCRGEHIRLQLFPSCFNTWISLHPTQKPTRMVHAIVLKGNTHLLVILS